MQHSDIACLTEPKAYKAFSCELVFKNDSFTILYSIHAHNNCSVTDTYLKFSTDSTFIMSHNKLTLTDYRFKQAEKFTMVKTITKHKDIWITVGRLLKGTLMYRLLLFVNNTGNLQMPYELMSLKYTSLFLVVLNF